MNRREFLKTTTTLGVSASLTQLSQSVADAWAASLEAKRDPSGKPYNIILIIRDQLSYHLFSPPDYQMPATEKLKRRGTSFEHHYIAAAMCTPSRGAIFSGQPPQINVSARVKHH